MDDDVGIDTETDSDAGSDSDDNSDSGNGDDGRVNSAIAPPSDVSNINPKPSNEDNGATLSSFKLLLLSLLAVAVIMAGFAIYFNFFLK